MDLINTAHGMKVKDGNMGLILLVVSIFVGPISTIIAGFMAGDDACKKAGIIVGILQYLLVALFGIGYFWGIFNAFKIWQNSK